MKARISLLHKTEAEWLKLSTFIPEEGELIIYDPDNSYPYARLKIGDGKRALVDLEFFIDSTVAALLKASQYSEIIDAGNIKDYLT